MSRALPILVLLGVPAARAEADPEPPSTAARELRALQGTWTAVRLRVKGKEAPPPRAGSYTFAGSTLTITADKYEWTYKVRIDARARPFTIELVSEGEERGTHHTFKVEKGKLFLCRGVPGPDDVRNDVFTGESRPVLILSRERQ